MIETTCTTTELDALAEAFKEWVWREGSIEPDARVQVLIEEPASETKFLVRHQHGWLWATNASNAVARSKGEQTTVSWNYAVDGLNGELRIPTAEELRAGGWTIEETGDSEDEERIPLATHALLGARNLLERENNRAPFEDEVNEATALALTSIAATLHDLSVLLEEEFEWRRSQRPDPSDSEDESGEDDSAHRSLGPGENPTFPFAGRP